MSHLIHVTDLHFHKPWFHWLAREAARRSLGVVISGDMLQAGVGIAQERRWVRDWLEAAATPVVVCTGNHDVDDDFPSSSGAPRWLRDIKNPLVTVDLAVARLDGLRAVPLPFMHGFSGDDHPAYLGAEILVHHEPPAGTKLTCPGQGYSLCGSDHFRAHLENTLKPPFLALCGHVHAPPAWWDRIGQTLCLNPGVDPFRRHPRHILVDLEARTAQLNGRGKPVKF